MEVIGTPEFNYLDGWVNTFINIVYYNLSKPGLWTADHINPLLLCVCLLMWLQHFTLLSWTDDTLFWSSVFVSSFPVLFWKLTSLSFQVPCPSSCVKCVIVFPDSQSVSACSPWLLLYSNSLCRPCLVPVWVSVSSFTLASMIHSYHSHRFLEPAVERSSCRVYPFVLVVYSIALV